MADFYQYGHPEDDMDRDTTGKQLTDEQCQKVKRQMNEFWESQDTTPTKPEVSGSGEGVVTADTLSVSPINTLTGLGPDMPGRPAQPSAAGPINPDMPSQQLKMHLGEMTAQEERTARAAITLAQSVQATASPAALEWNGLKLIYNGIPIGYIVAAGGGSSFHPHFFAESLSKACAEDQAKKLVEDRARFWLNLCGSSVRDKTVCRSKTAGNYHQDLGSDADQGIDCAVSVPSTGWQDIATAPENVSVLVYLPKFEHYGNGVLRAILVNMGTGRRWHSSGYHVGRDIDPAEWPTHWMPLPASPLQGGEK